jgi:hypothetical protein
MNVSDSQKDFNEEYMSSSIYDDNNSDYAELKLEMAAISKCPFCYENNLCMYHSSLFDNNVDLDGQSVFGRQVSNMVDLKMTPSLSNGSVSDERMLNHEESHLETGMKTSAKRYDVCIKSILRSMRRFYCHKMETSTAYKRKEKKIKFKHENLIKCCQLICEDLKLSEYSPNMSFYFSLFAYSCDMRKVFEKYKVNVAISKTTVTPEVAERIMMINKAISIINLIENTLNRFSKKIFNRLIDIPEVAYLVQYFLEHGKETLQAGSDYEECIQILDNKTKDVNNEEEANKKRIDYYITEPFFKTLELAGF